MSRSTQTLERIVREMAARWIANNRSDEVRGNPFDFSENVVRVDALPSPVADEVEIRIKSSLAPPDRWAGFSVSGYLLAVKDADGLIHRLTVEVEAAMRYLHGLYGPEHRALVRAVMDFAERISWGDPDEVGPAANRSVPATREKEMRDMLLVAADMALEKEEKMLGHILQAFAGGVQ